MSDNEIINFMEKHIDWIMEKQEFILNNKIKAPLKYMNGEKHYLWGKEYNLQILSKKNIKKVFIDEKNIYIPVNKKNTIETRKKILDEFYRMELKKAIPQVLDECIEIVGKMPNEVKVRKMKNWGNCKYSNKTITLNLKLASKNIKCLKYVLIHELTHLIEFNHGPHFKKLMDEFCPNWKEIKKELNE